MIALSVFILAAIQNIAFTMASRSRNRDHMSYHAVCSVFSNSIWFVTMHYLVVSDITWELLIPYVSGTAAGSVCGAKVSMRIESWLGAKV